MRGNFSGPVYPVNPDAVSVQGVRAYAVGHRHPRPGRPGRGHGAGSTVAEVVEACRAKGVHGLVVMTAGFADAGDWRRRRAAQRQLVRVARAAGMRVLGPNCLGLVNTDPRCG